MAWLCGAPSLFDLADLGGDSREIGRYGLQCFSARPVGTRLGQVSLTQLLDLRFRGNVLVFGAGEVEHGLLHEPRRLGALEEDEILVLPHWIPSHEMQLVPERVDFAP